MFAIKTSISAPRARMCPSPPGPRLRKLENHPSVYVSGPQPREDLIDRVEWLRFDRRFDMTVRRGDRYVQPATRAQYRHQPHD